MHPCRFLLIFLLVLHLPLSSSSPLTLYILFFKWKAEVNTAVCRGGNDISLAVERPWSDKRTSLASTLEEEQSEFVDKRAGWSCQLGSRDNRCRLMAADIKERRRGIGRETNMCRSGMWAEPVVRKLTHLSQQCRYNTIGNGT